MKAIHVFDCSQQGRLADRYFDVVVGHRQGARRLHHGFVPASAGLCSVCQARFVYRLVVLCLASSRDGTHKSTSFETSMACASST